MIISAIGDSLTEGDYGIPGKRGIANVHAENYPYFLSLETGYEVRNFGLCGATPSSYLSKYYNAGKANVSGSDRILVMLGTNGGLDPDADCAGNRDYEALLLRLREDAPDAEIILCTPPHVTENPLYSNCGYAERVDRAVRFVRRFAAEKGYELFDVAACGLFTEETESTLQGNDGLHFTKAGYRILAGYFAEKLRQFDAKSHT